MERSNFGKRLLKPDDVIVKDEPQDNTEIENRPVNELHHPRNPENIEKCETSSQVHFCQMSIVNSQIVVKKEPIDIDDLEESSNNDIDSLQMLDCDLEPVEIIFKTEPQVTEKIQEMTRPAVEIVYVPADMNEIEIKDEPIELESIRLSANKETEPMQAADAKLRCKMCPKELKNRQSLSTHMRDQHKEKKFDCKKCDMKFATKSYLLRHMPVHSEDRPWKCQNCNESFKRNSELGLHTRRMHSNERRFSCSFCSKDFLTNFELIQHERIHTGEKPFVCKICSKQFTAKKNLKVHKRTHGEKQFSCSICSREYFHKTTLVNHMAKKHNCGLESIATSSKN